MLSSAEVTRMTEWPGWPEGAGRPDTPGAADRSHLPADYATDPVPAQPEAATVPGVEPRAQTAIDSAFQRHGVDFTAPMSDTVQTDVVAEPTSAQEEEQPSSGRVAESDRYDLSAQIARRAGRLATTRVQNAQHPAGVVDSRERPLGWGLANNLANQPRRRQRYM